MLLSFCPLIISFLQVSAICPDDFLSFFTAKLCFCSFAWFILLELHRWCPIAIFQWCTGQCWGWIQPGIEICELRWLCLSYRKKSVANLSSKVGASCQLRHARACVIAIKEQQAWHTCHGKTSGEAGLSKRPYNIQSGLNIYPQACMLLMLFPFWCPNLDIHPAVCQSGGVSPTWFIQVRTTLLVDGLLAEQGLLGWISKHVCDYFLCMMYLKYCLEYLFLKSLSHFSKKTKTNKKP